MSRVLILQQRPLLAVAEGVFAGDFGDAVAGLDEAVFVEGEQAA